MLFPEPDTEVSNNIHENPALSDVIKNKYSLLRNLERRGRQLPKQIDRPECFIKALGGKVNQHTYQSIPFVVLD